MVSKMSRESSAEPSRRGQEANEPRTQINERIPMRSSTSWLAAVTDSKPPPLAILRKHSVSRRSNWRLRKWSTQTPYLFESSLC